MATNFIDAMAEVRRLRALVATKDEALRTIRTICAETHQGVARAHAALSRVDGVAREGLGES